MSIHRYKHMYTRIRGTGIFRKKKKKKMKKKEEKIKREKDKEKKAATVAVSQVSSLTSLSQRPTYVSAFYSNQNQARSR